jgi:hypothetical protein
MPSVKNFNWDSEIKLTRKQIISLGVMADFIGNVCKILKADFPSIANEINEEAVCDAFHEFRRAYMLDQETYKQLSALVHKLNND